MAAPYPQVVLFGDSLFELSAKLQDGFSFFGALQNHCARRYDVVNRGFSGYNTSQAVKMLEKVFPKPEAGGPKMKYLLILLGANDASVPRDTENQAVPLDAYTRNLRHIITHPHITAHAPKILLITPPPTDDIRTAELDLPRRGHNTHESARQAAYSQAAREVGASVPGVVVVDYQRALMEYAQARTPAWREGMVLGSAAQGGERGYLERLLPDGLHLSGEAYKVLFGLVEGQIEADGGCLFPDWKVAEWTEE